jgi:hydrogenase maturation protease
MTTTTTEARDGLRVLVGGIGYRFLRDGSVGGWVTDTLMERAGDGIEVEDLSYHPVGLHQNLEDRLPYDRIVLAAAVARGRAPGTVTTYRWDGVLPPPEEIQDRVSEAVTGVIGLDNTLIVCAALGSLPADVRVVEVEPEDEGWGEGFSDTVAAVLPEVLEAVWTSTGR